MALLNTAETRLSVMVMIARQLLGSEGTGLPESDLKASLSMKSESTDVIRSLAGMKLIGLFKDEQEEDNLRELTEESASALTESLESFIKHVRMQVMAPACNTDPWGKQGGARDLTTSLAHYLSLPFAEAESNFTEMNNHQLRDLGRAGREGAVRDTNQWAAFYRWTCALGFGWLDLNEKLIPDPTVALLDVLPEIFIEKTVLHGNVFLKSISELLPVLDGGNYQKFVRKNGLKSYREAPNILSDGLSFALRNLEEMGKVTLINEPDAGNKVVRLSPSVLKDQFSEVRYCNE